MSAPPPDLPATRRRQIGPLIFSLALLAFGLLVAYQATQIRQGGGFTVVGPRVFAYIAAAGIIILAVVLLLRATVRPDQGWLEGAASEEAVTHWPSVGITLAILVLYPFAMGSLGYVLATAAFVPLVARVLGSRRPLRDLLVGLGLSLVIYIGFTRGLSVRLPAGLLPF